MSLPDVIACATVNAARAVHLDHAGTLAVGKPADVAIFGIDEGDYRFYDVQMHERSGDKLLVNTLTMVDGHELAHREERELHFWATVPEIQRAVRVPGVGVPVADDAQPDELLDALYDETDVAEE
jgi:dihydroorotase